MFFIHIYFLTSSLTLPCAIAGFLHPFYTFSPAPCRVIRGTFIFNHSVIFLPRALRFWVGTGVFDLTLLPEILAQPAFIKVSLGAGSYFLEIFRASYWSSKHRPGPSVCLIHSNLKSSYSERFSFKFYHILAWIACGESLIYLLLTRFKPFSLVQSHMQRLLKNTLRKTKLATLVTASINIKVILSIIENNQYLTDMRRF